MRGTGLVAESGGRGEDGAVWKEETEDVADDIEKAAARVEGARRPPSGCGLEVRIGDSLLDVG